jgi:hypothetical protein
MRGILLSLAFVFMTGCYTEADIGYGGGGYVAGGPALVEVSPGVQVIADYDEPIFFSDGLYWRSTGGVWYSSRVYNGGWAVNYNAPYAVRGISNPGVYAHYRGGGTAVYGRGGYNGAYRGGGGPAVRDHRSAPATYRAAPAARGPVVRDHRR